MPIKYIGPYCARRGCRGPAWRDRLCPRCYRLAQMYGKDYQMFGYQPLHAYVDERDSGVALPWDHWWEQAQARGMGVADLFAKPTAGDPPFDPPDPDLYLLPFVGDPPDDPPPDDDAPAADAPPAADTPPAADASPAADTPPAAEASPAAEAPPAPDAPHAADPPPAPDPPAASDPPAADPDDDPKPKRWFRRKPKEPD